MEQYKLLAVDSEGKNCYVDLRQLIDHITSKVLESLPRSYKLTNTDGWIAKQELYFDYRVAIPTNVGVFSKVNDTPAIISFVRFYTEEGHVVGRLIFVSPDRKGCIYRSPDGKQHPNPKQHGEMFYNITQEDVRLESNCAVSSFSNYIFGTEDDAVREFIKSAEIQPAEYFSVFPNDGDILLALGAHYKDDVMNAPIIFDREGHIWCNGVYNKEGKEVSSKC